jgi:hypothetical protein
MATIQGPNILDNNLVFYYDTSNENSYKGRPTSNLVGTSISIYNNVPTTVSNVLVTTSEWYKDSVVYKQTLTPLDVTGVSQLTNANNPGIGVISSGGGGLANRYTGHSIFFKPMVPMNSQPIFTNYSNITGWQSSNIYESMGDGWFRAKVIWFDTVTRSDGKYWAINPLNATIGVPITIYWAGPFKEDLNSTFISRYTVGTRSNTSALLPLVLNPVSMVTIDLTNVSFSNEDIIFDGTNDTIDIGIGNTYFPLYSFSCETWIKSSGLGVAMTEGGIFAITYGLNVVLNSSGQIYFYIYDTIGSTFNGVTSTGASKFDNVWHNVVCCNDGITSYIYIDGVFNNSIAARWTGTTAWPTSNAYLGRDNNNTIYFLLGSLALPKIYNKCLTSSEVLQNYNSTKNKFI